MSFLYRMTFQICGDVEEVEKDHSRLTQQSVSKGLVMMAMGSILGQKADFGIYEVSEDNGRTWSEMGRFTGEEIKSAILDIERFQGVEGMGTGV